MAYRRYNNRKRTHKRKTLSNYNIATKTSAKAQARQIYSLKKRMNWAIKRITPEIQIQQRNSSADIIPVSSGGSRISWEYSGEATDPMSYIIPTFYPDDSTTIGTAPNDRFKRLRSFKLFGNWQYTGDLSSTPTPITMRIVIVQTRTTRNQAISPEDIFTSGSSGPSAFNAVYGPLQNGVARTCKILSDKRYQLNYQRPNVTISTSLRYLLNVYRDINTSADGGVSSDAVPKGAIHVFYAIYSPAGVFSANQFSIGYKLAFTD